MKVIDKVPELREILSLWKKEGKVVGLVPTMGWFHEGHLSLMRLARKKADKVIVTLFVNPIQFGPSEDLESYPRDLERDRKLAEHTGADVLFFPAVEDMYPSGYQTKVVVKELTQCLCGASRPGHFDGVTTVVSKLFNLTQPDIAVFGEKDFQQLAVIRRMVVDLNFPITIIGHPIVREEDGLAMSSRNSYLEEEERKNALCLHRAIIHAQERVKKNEKTLACNDLIAEIKDIIHATSGYRIDYVSIFDEQSLIPNEYINEKSVLALAVTVNDRVRLIDNCHLQGHE